MSTPTPAVTITMIDTELLQRLFDKVESLERFVVTNQDDGYLNQKEAATFLRISVDTLKTWDDKNLTRYTSIGDMKRYRKRDLVKTMDTYSNR